MQILATVNGPGSVPAVEGRGTRIYESLESGYNNVRQHATEAGRLIGQEVRTTSGAVWSEAKEAIHDASHAARHEVADRLERAAAHTDSQAMSQRLSQGLHSTANYLRDNSVSKMASNASFHVKQNRGTYVAVAFGLGAIAAYYALSRRGERRTY